MEKESAEMTLDEIRDIVKNGVEKVRAQVGNEEFDKDPDGASISRWLYGNEDLGEDLEAARLLDCGNKAEVISFCHCREAAGDSDVYARGPVPDKAWHKDCIRFITPNVMRRLLEIRATYLGKQFPSAMMFSDNGDYSPIGKYEYCNAVREMYEWAAMWFRASGPGPYDYLPEWERDALFEWRKAQDLKDCISCDMMRIADIVVHDKDTDPLQETESLFEKDDRTPEQKISGLKESILKSKEELKNMPYWTKMDMPYWTWTKM